MKDLSNITKFYFIGIGGIGMSALARYFHAIGKEVAGYDKTPSDITQKLNLLGISVVFEDDAAALKFGTVAETLVVYTPAIPKDSVMLNAFIDSGYTVKKRAEVLGLITRDMTCLAVAGTHGKTTTSSMLAHIMAASGVPVTAFLGGITENYKSNYIQTGTDAVVVEADEFDRSFLQLSPDIACITSMDADHLDIYGEKAALDQSFQDFANLVKEDGKLVFRKGLPLNGITIGVEEVADYSAECVKITEGKYAFDLKYPEGILTDLTLSLPGRHNLYNATTALAMAIEYGVDSSKLASALAGFSGVDRRFSYRINTDELVLIDDYAHHPTEINAVHQSVREMYPDKKALVVFQPHLFSRTRDFMDDFAASLSAFDEVMLLEIYPAREQPITGITSGVLLEKISQERKKIVVKENLLEAIKASETRIVVMLGAGDIGVEILKITKSLSQ